MKKIPLRRCIVTREQLPKQELLRIVRDKEGKVSVDQTGKLGGRGAYIKKDIEVLNTAKSKNILSRVLEVNIPEEVYQEIDNSNFLHRLSISLTLLSTSNAYSDTLIICITS